MAKMLRNYCLITCLCICLSLGTELNIARLAKLNVSSTAVYNIWDYNKSNSVDGIVREDIDSCGCCFSSAGEDAPYFEAQIKRQYQINQIIVIGRQDNTHYFNDLTNITIYLDNINTTFSYETSNTIVVVPSTPKVQSIMIQKHSIAYRKVFLAICEIKIMAHEYEKVKLINIGNSFQVMNIAKSAALQASSKLIGNGEYEKENAVDGITLTRDDACGCCYCSNTNVSPFFVATLPGLYDVLQVVIDGKNSGSRATLKGIIVSLDRRALSDIIIYPNNTAYISVNMNGQVVRVEHRGKFLFICEIRIFVPECIAGTFGPDCKHDRHCINYEVCNRATSECVNGCYAELRGNNCSIECIAGTFGPGCKHDCHCINNEVCNKITGDCGNGCASGWRGNNCSLECGYNQFGPDCHNTCHCINNSSCDSIYGTCRLHECSPGWLGDSCNIKCPERTFGFKCQHICGFCKDNTTCNHTSGECQNGCASSYTGSECKDHNKEECGYNQFGPDCHNTCHCINNSSCDSIYGTCRLHECSPGWLGDSCNIKCPERTFGFKCQHICGFCKDNTTCNHISGECQNGCASSYTGSECKDHNKEECQPGYFGDTCQYKCGSCRNNLTCDHMSGVCPRGCEINYTGISCKEYVPENKPETSVVGIALGTTAAIVIVCLVAVIIVLIMRRKKISSPKNCGETEHTYEKPSVYITPTESSDYATLQHDSTYVMTRTSPE